MFLFAKFGTPISEWLCVVEEKGERGSERDTMTIRGVQTIGREESRAKREQLTWNTKNNNSFTEAGRKMWTKYKYFQLGE